VLCSLAIFAHGSGDNQLQRNRFLGDQGSGLHPFSRRPEFTFCVHNLRGVAFGTRCLAIARFMLSGNATILTSTAVTLSPRFGLAVNDFLQLWLMMSRCGKQVVHGGLPQDAAPTSSANKRSRFPEFSTSTRVHWIDRRGNKPPAVHRAGSCPGS